MSTDVRKREGGARRHSTLRCAMALVLCALITGCVTQTKSFVTQNDIQPAPGSRVLLLPLDIELNVLTTSGLEEPNAAWTQTARRNVNEALKRILKSKQAAMLRYVGPDGPGVIAGKHLQTVKLHEAVGSSILLHKYLVGYNLPTKVNRFDWTLGDSVAALRQDYGADYALFVYLRDSFSSSGRAALILVGAVMGVGVQGGQQKGFASLVDLKTGDVVWFNFLASNVGDLRDAEAAFGATEQLLASSPL